jgi:uncharacterized lipoprotein YmbA
MFRKIILAALITLPTLAIADAEDAVLAASGIIKAAGCGSSESFRMYTHYKDCGVVLTTPTGDKAFKIEDQELSKELGRTAVVIKYSDGVYHILLGEK